MLKTKLKNGGKKKSNQVITINARSKPAGSKPTADAEDKEIRAFLESLLTKIGGDSSAGHRCGKQLHELMMTESGWNEMQTRIILLNVKQDVADLINKVKNPQQSEFIEVCITLYLLRKIIQDKNVANRQILLLIDLLCPKIPGMEDKYNSSLRVDKERMFSFLLVACDSIILNYCCNLFFQRLPALKAPSAKGDRDLWVNVLKPHDPLSTQYMSDLARAYLSTGTFKRPDELGGIEAPLAKIHTALLRLIIDTHFSTDVNTQALLEKLEDGLNKAAFFIKYHHTIGTEESTRRLETHGNDIIRFLTSSIPLLRSRRREKESMDNIIALLSNLAKPPEEEIDISAESLFGGDSGGDSGDDSGDDSEDDSEDDLEEEPPPQRQRLG